MYKKLIVLGIIVLFFGISVAPGITANNSYFKKTAQKISEKETLNDDLAEITVQLCKADGVESHTVFLTKDQSDKLDDLIKTFKADLDKVETMEETIKLFYDMVVYLDELGLLSDDISIVEAQELVTDVEGINNPENMVHRIQSNDLYYTHFQNSKSQSEENRLCLVAGDTDETSFINPRGIILFGLFYTIFELISDYGFLEDFLEKYFPLLYEFYGELCIFLLTLMLIFGLSLSNFRPILRRNVVNLGYIRCMEYFPAHGWVFSNGLNGIKRWEGSLFGDLFGYESDGSCSGIFGFTGIHLIGLKPNFYLGCAMWIKIAEYGGGSLNAE